MCRQSTVAATFAGRVARFALRRTFLEAACKTIAHFDQVIGRDSEEQPALLTEHTHSTQNRLRWEEKQN